MWRAHPHALGTVAQWHKTQGMAGSYLELQARLSRPGIPRQLSATAVDRAFRSALVPTPARSSPVLLHSPVRDLFFDRPVRQSTHTVPRAPSGEDGRCGPPAPAPAHRSARLEYVPAETDRTQAVRADSGGAVSTNAGGRSPDLQR